jgi:hypothetical protein
LSVRFILFASLSASACDGCDGSFLDPLRPDLKLSPAHTEVTAWIGYDTLVSLTAENAGRAYVDVETPLLEGAPEALGASPPLEGFRIEIGQSARVDITLAPVEELTASLTLTLRGNDVEPVSATIDVVVRTPTECTPRQSCEIARFDPARGECVRESRPDGAQCDDNSACTEDDRCSLGACVGRAVTCADNVECTIDACNPQRGCVFEPVDTRCLDDNPCTADACVPSTGCSNTVLPDGTPCGAFSCETFSACVFGACITSPTPDGFPCEDGDLCTQGDSCQSQTCSSGTRVDPVASDPVPITTPPWAEIDPDIRWFPEVVPVGDDVLYTAMHFGSALDVTQGLVGGRPMLAILWKSAPIGVYDCQPWDMWADPPNIPSLIAGSSETPQFCATALMATFIDEAELADGGGTSVQLEVIYGTVDASFLPSQSVTNDLIEVVVSGSTYHPRPDSRREIVIEKMTLSLSAREIVERSILVHQNLPESGVESNVHSGLRIAADELGMSLIGWDLPRPDSTADGSEPPSDGVSFTLDRAAIVFFPEEDEGAVEWTPLIGDGCEEMPTPTEDIWRNVHVVRDGSGGEWAVLQHNDLDEPQDECDPRVIQSQVSAIALSEDVVTTLSQTALAASITGNADNFAVINNTDNVCGPDGCPWAELVVQPYPFDQLDPTITQRSIALDEHVVPYSVAALGVGFGALGAVVIEEEIGGDSRVRLIDRMETDTPLELSTSPFFIENHGLVALRSPLSPQSVYAVTTMRVVEAESGDEVDQPVLVRFGCPFPTAPSFQMP